jgi:hypothetical protein
VTACTCPVCKGRGFVPNGFYHGTEQSWTTNSLLPESCRSCQGAGFVTDKDLVIVTPTPGPIEVLKNQV